eukprot:CAMPEP_0204592736 /NCGR_PEP_ID=MMETSP0661-20131031/51107_1 /ASSEMBLY_ACC=CAM_ASM_000606 /TAXON_ID=109239 /ORGANISM="Alexandrium margalefi, Strain AMGDE01CS-322" /LENGTH=61 /DNA_ID=CAMNT_0051602975 /DNA_START=12 /DNA_END=197 /DNA_ORIENTATION=-
MSDWTEWSRCEKRRDDGIKAAVRMRLRVVTTAGRAGRCGPTRDFSVCEDGGIIEDVRYGFR